jgi:hypothetical protein
MKMPQIARRSVADLACWVSELSAPKRAQAAGDEGKDLASGARTAADEATKTAEEAKSTVLDGVTGVLDSELIRKDVRCIK